MIFFSLQDSKYIFNVPSLSCSSGFLMLTPLPSVPSLTLVSARVEQDVLLRTLKREERNLSSLAETLAQMELQHWSTTLNKTRGALVRVSRYILGGMLSS